MPLNMPKGYYLFEPMRRRLILSPSGTAFIAATPNSYQAKPTIHIQKITTGYPNPKATYMGRFNHMEEWQQFDKLQTLVTVMCAQHRMLKK